jgi:hypothetical protein
VNRLSPSTLLMISIACVSLSVLLLGARLTRLERDSFDLRQRLRGLTE